MLVTLHKEFSMSKRVIFSLLMVFLIFSCKGHKGDDNPQPNKKDYKALGDATIEVFKNTPIVFDSKKVPNGYNAPDANGVIRLVNGRLVLKKFEIPKYERNVSVKLKVRLVSGGDPYDRSGSIFILSDSKDGVNPISIAKGSKYPGMEGDLNKYPGIIKLEDYEPCVEAMRFMTPFGVGCFSNQPTPAGIDAWERDVKWECDISHLYSLLEDDAYLGCWIDTWVKGGFLIDVKLEITESKENKPIEKYKVLPLINTVPYIGQNYPDVFAHYKDGIKVKSNAKAKKEAKLYYTTTGHGGYDGGDEFTKRENIISLNNNEIHKFIPWIESCKEYRKWNPTSGDVGGGQTSSDLNRSNWCPGSIVSPIVIPLDKGSLTDGTFSFAIPKAQKAMGDNMLNFWLVSSYVVYR